MRINGSVVGRNASGSQYHRVPTGLVGRVVRVTINDLTIRFERHDAHAGGHNRYLWLNIWSCLAEQTLDFRIDPLALRQIEIVDDV